MSAINGNPELDFKDQNPILSQIGMFKTLYKKAPKSASNIIWAMYMIEEANTDLNPLARITEREERINEVAKTYYKVDTKSEDYKALVSDFSKFALTKEQSLYRIHVSKFEELTAYLKELSLDVDKEFDKYIKIMEKLDKMWKGLEMVKNQMVEAESKSKVRGNAQLSAREKRK